VVEEGERQVDESKSRFRMNGYTMKIPKTKKKEERGERRVYIGVLY